MLRSITIVEPALQPRRLPFAQPFQPDPSLVLWLLPQRDVKWYDYSGKGNHGTIHGAAWKPGRAGPGLYFNGSSAYVDCGSDESLDITDAITIAAWVKGVYTASTMKGVVSKTVSVNLNGFSLGVYNQKPIFYVCTGNWEQAISPDSIDDNKWYHIVGTYDKSLANDNIKIYVDAIFKDAHSQSSGILSNAVAVKIAISEINHLNGTISEVRIYNRALSGAEIGRIFRVERVWYGV